MELGVPSLSWIKLGTHRKVISSHPGDVGATDGYKCCHLGCVLSIEPQGSAIADPVGFAVESTLNNLVLDNYEKRLVISIAKRYHMPEEQC
jgi:hypothetical protein